MKIFRTQLQVRGYEIDGYGHVNNAVYLNYAETARWAMIEEAAGGGDYFKRNGVAPIVARAEIDYREPCYLGEWLEVETTLIESRKRLSRFNHVVKKRDTGRVAAVALVTILCVSSSGRAVTMPADFTALFGGGS